MHRKRLYPIFLLALGTFRAKKIKMIEVKGQRKHRVSLS